MREAIMRNRGNSKRVAPVDELVGLLCAPCLVRGAIPPAIQPNPSDVLVLGQNLFDLPAQSPRAALRLRLQWPGTSLSKQAARHRNDAKKNTPLSQARHR
eukprot:1008375-Rhodomonas_salina.2